MPLCCLDNLRRRANARSTRSGPVRQDMSLQQLLKVKSEMGRRLDHLAVDKVTLRHLW
jgi:hypothetical protein